MPQFTQAIENWCQWCVIKTQYHHVHLALLNICNQILKSESFYMLELYHRCRKCFFLLVGIFIWKLYKSPRGLQVVEIMLNRELPNITVKTPLKRQFINRIMHFTFRYFLSQKQSNLRRKNKYISSEGHILLHLMS